MIGAAVTLGRRENMIMMQVHHGEYIWFMYAAGNHPTNSRGLESSTWYNF
jgi:hypothetical protein